MSKRTLSMTDTLHAYLLEVSVDEPDVMRRLRAETSERADAQMQIAPEQGAFMSWLIRTLGAKSAIEVGTYTGYSALALARALPADGRLICCDLNEETTSIARRYWQEAGLSDRIELRLGPALETLQELLDDGGAGGWDFVFIDADKTSYDAYYECSVQLLRRGGVIALDNVLWSGAVADASDTSAATVALRNLNAKIAADPRVDVTLLPIADGLTLARKR